MTINFNSLSDFYIDNDGDVKIGVSGKNESEFLGNPKKFNSVYLTANNVQEILDILEEINPNFNVSTKNLFKVYSKKSRAIDDNNGVKVYYDVDFLREEIHCIMSAYEIYSNGDVFSEVFFLPNDASLSKKLFKFNGAEYWIKKFSTHKILLHSVKYDSNENLLDFKTYYCHIDNPISYDDNFIANIKKISHF